MYKNKDEAIEAAKNVSGRKFITESKLTSTSRKTVFNFRFFEDDKIIGVWFQNKDRSYSRVVAIV